MMLACWGAAVDGMCCFLFICCSLKAVLERQDNRKGLISFIDISDPYYDPLAVSWGF
jgi:hypothetical protein